MDVILIFVNISLLFMYVTFLFQALLLTLLAAQVNHASSNIDVEIVYEYLAQASVAFPTVFPIM